MHSIGSVIFEIAIKVYEKIVYEKNNNNTNTNKKQTNKQKKKKHPNVC